MEPVQASIAAEPLQRFGLFRSSDLDETRQIVSSKFCDHGLNLKHPGMQLDAVHNHIAGRAISLNYLRYGAEVQIAPGCLERFYLVQIPLKGAARVRHGCDEVESQIGQASLLSPHLETRMEWSATCEQVLVQIDRKRLEQHAEALLGYAPGGTVSFDPHVDLTSGPGARWFRDVALCFQSAEAGRAFGTKSDGIAQPLIEEALLTKLLHMQPGTLFDALSTRPRKVANRYVRRAQEFIHANLTQSITAEDIASAAGTSLRNLQYAFREQFGCTPLDYLRHERMSYSHMELARGGGEETVASIATRAGFTHLSRFSRAFKQRYGYLPRDAVKKTRQS